MKVSGCLRAHGLGKRFPGVVALDDVSLEVPRGQVLALVGANGAGKSTLIKILTGYYGDYAGQVEVDGEPARLRVPADASRYGIAAVYQEVDTVLYPQLSVTENLLMNDIVERRNAPVVRWSALHRRAEEILARYRMRVDVRRRVDELVLHEKQMLVIARAVARNARYLIFDEPTTSLSLREIGQLFDVVRSLKDMGVGIIYISHRLMEVQELADTIAVLRGGRKVAEMPGSEFDVGRISEAMLGQALTELYPPKRAAAPGEVVLEARGLARRGKLAGVDVTVREGEILGIAGLVGAGKTELLRALFGADRLDAGELRLDGRPVRIGCPDHAVAQGVFLIPEERRSQGVLVDETVRANTTLPFLEQFSRWFGFVSRRLEMRHTRSTIDKVGLTPPNPEMVVAKLSGGNQQKVAIGKWFGRPPRVMMFDEATQGIDVKAKRDVYELAQAVADRAAVIYASSEIDEVVGLADRVLVMRDGRCVAELAGDDIHRKLILEYATGARPPATNPAEQGAR